MLLVRGGLGCSFPSVLPGFVPSRCNLQVWLRLGRGSGGTEGASGRGIYFGAGVSEQGGCKFLTRFFCRSGISSALAGLDPNQLASFCSAPKAEMFAGCWCWEVGGDPPGTLPVPVSWFSVSLLQEIAQINEDNLTAYNRCALFALGAAYLNLISQLITVPTFCQHIHEVRRARAESLRAAAPPAPARFELGSLPSAGHPDAAEGGSLSAP